MFGGLWNFIRRHRRKIAISGIILGGIYCFGRYAEKKLIEYKEKKEIEVFLCARKQQHFISTQLICKETIKSLIGNLRHSICQKINMNSLLEELKNKPHKKLEIWEEMKILSLTGIICTIYATCILILSLEIQMNLIAGKLIRNAMSSRKMFLSFSEGSISSDSHAHYLSKIEYFLDKGIDDLLASVTAAVKEVASDMTLKDQISIQAFHGLVASIRRKVEIKEQNGYHDYVSFSLLHFMKFLEPEGMSEQASSASSMKQVSIQEKTYEVLTGCDFQATSNICLDWCFNYLVKRYEDIFELDNDAPTDNTINGKVKSKPLARVIPILNNETSAMLSDHPNNFLTEFMEVSCINNFALNVYNQACQIDL